MKPQKNKEFFSCMLLNLSLFQRFLKIILYPQNLCLWCIPHAYDLHSFNIPMAIVSHPTLLNGTRLFVSNSPPKLTPQARNSYSPTTSHKNIRTRICACVAKCHPQFLHQPLIETSFSSRHRDLLPLVPSNAKTSSGSGEEDNPAVETVLKLYTSIKNKNIRELSDIIGDECRCVCNFFSFFQPFQGKQACPLNFQLAKFFYLEL